MDLTLFVPAVRDLLAEDRLFDLGPGRPVESKRETLAALTPENLFSPAPDPAAPPPLRRRDDALACLSGLWLYYDFLDESHNLSQSISTVEGSYWHGILHRREPDYSNAAYWYRRVGRHPVYAKLGPAAERLAAELSLDIPVPAPWDPYWFIDFCQECANRSDARTQLARLIKKQEWELLFVHCCGRVKGEG